MKSITCVLLMLLIGCTRPTNSESKTQSSLVSNQTSSCSKFITIDTLKQSILSLNYNEFDTSSIKKVFKEPCVFKVNTTYPNSSSFICSFKTNNSEVIISSKGFKLDYYLDYARITDNSIRLNYNIEIGMNREAFFHNIKQPIEQCDSIKITEIGSMSLFVFDKNKLKEIVLTTTI